MESLERAARVTNTLLLAQAMGEDVTDVFALAKVLRYLEVLESQVGREVND